MSDETPIEHELIRNAALLDIELVESDVQPTVGEEDWFVRAQLQVDDELVASCAHGLIFSIGVLSFHDGRPSPGNGSRTMTNSPPRTCCVTFASRTGSSTCTWTTSAADASRPL